jgi:hypothetical protein
MIEMANDKPASAWRNFAAWSAVGAGFYIVVVWAASMLVNGDGLGTLFAAMFKSQKLAASLGLGLIFTMAVLGFSSWKRPLSLRSFRNFLVLNAVAIALLLLAVWGFRAFGGAGAMDASAKVAAASGLVLIVIALLGSFALASVHAGSNLVNDEVAAEELRERGRLILCSLAWMAACGVLLIVLGLAGPGGALPPAAALTGALVLLVALAVLGIAAWRLSDELGRTLSHETGNMAFYLILVLGGGWAILAHLGFVTAPAPLDWLTLFTVLLFAATFIVLGRRKMLTR